MLINADARVCIIDLMAYWTSHYLLRLPPAHPHSTLDTLCK